MSLLVIYSNRFFFKRGNCWYFHKNVDKMHVDIEQRRVPESVALETALLDVLSIDTRSELQKSHRRVTNKHAPFIVKALALSLCVSTTISLT